MSTAFEVGMNSKAKNNHAGVIEWEQLIICGKNNFFTDTI